MYSIGFIRWHINIKRVKPKRQVILYIISLLIYILYIYNIYIKYNKTNEKYGVYNNYI